ncbi:hypothetical protein ABPG77_008729 [Micractinium sp. CCAP 211/92]
MGSLLQNRDAAIELGERLHIAGQQLQGQATGPGSNPALQWVADRLSEAARAVLDVVPHLSSYGGGAGKWSPLRTCLTITAFDGFKQTADVQVPVVEDLAAAGDQLLYLQLSAGILAMDCTALASMSSVYADIYAGELLGVVELALCHLAKIGQGVSEMPDELVGRIRRYSNTHTAFEKAQIASCVHTARAGGSSEAAEARRRCKQLCGPTLKGLVLKAQIAAEADQLMVFNGITRTSQDEEVFDLLVAAPMLELTNLRDSGSGVSSDFEHAALAVAGISLNLGTAHPAQLPRDNQELRHLLGQQVGKAELRGLRSVLISLEYACRGMEPTSEHLALLQYVRGELVAGWSSRHPDWRLHPWPAASQAAPGLLAAGSILEPLAELEETVRMGHLLPGEVETQLLELASYQNNIHCTYAKLCGKAGVQGAMVG